MHNTALRGVRATIVAMEKTKSITHSECVSVALGTLREMRMRHIISCGLSGSTKIIQNISLKARFLKKKKKQSYRKTKCVF